MASSRTKFQYQQIAEKVKDRILLGEIAVGEKLASERILMEEFGVQRNTIRQALAELEAGGHIVTEGRRGSFVLPPTAAARGGTFLVNIEPGSGPNGTALFEGVVHIANSLKMNVQRFSTKPLPNSSMNRLPDPEDLPPDTAGIILWPHHPINMARLQKLNDMVPVVLVDHKVAGTSLDCVRFDDAAGGRQVTEYLLLQGHSRIAFLTDEVFAESVQSRWQGYLTALEEGGGPYDPRLGLLYQSLDSEILGMTIAHLNQNPNRRPTAVICSNDLVAFALLRCLNTMGVRVPEDVAVTGYGNSMPQYAAAISLTTMDQPFFAMGQEAAKLLADRTRQTRSERLRLPKDISLPMKLVVRGST